MTTISPLRAAGTAAAVLAMTALGLGGGYAWGRTSDGATLAMPATLAAASTPAAGSTGITVSGTGSVSGTPDALNLSMGVSVTSPTVTAALQGANAAAEKVQALLKQRGVAAKDIQTSGLSVQPQYGGGDRPVITGYQVTESLTAVLRDLGKAGDIIGAAAQAGGDATRVDGVSLDLTDTGALLTAARTKAFQQAKDKAEQLARAAGKDLGAVVAISEVPTTPSPLPMYAAADARAEKAVPIAPGSQEVGVTVTVVFAFE
jgi:uncharacterized protein YggE